MSFVNFNGLKITNITILSNQLNEFTIECSLILSKRSIHSLWIAKILNIIHIELHLMHCLRYILSHNLGCSTRKAHLSLPQLKISPLWTIPTIQLNTSHHRILTIPPV